MVKLWSNVLVHLPVSHQIDQKVINSINLYINEYHLQLPFNLEHSHFYNPEIRSEALFSEHSELTDIETLLYYTLYNINNIKAQSILHVFIAFIGVIPELYITP